MGRKELTDVREVRERISNPSVGAKESIECFGKVRGNLLHLSSAFAGRGGSADLQTELDGPLMISSALQCTICLVECICND